MEATISMQLLELTHGFAIESDKFISKVAYCQYNPLIYAQEPHDNYISKFGNSTKKALFLGMNPGPWGMTQNGIPFGEINAVNEWLKISGLVKKPKIEHPARPIKGFECTKSEVSGRRFWGLMKTKYPNCLDFFRDHYVLNYCPLVFMTESGKNLTPDKLPAKEKNQLFELCDYYLVKTIDILQPEYLIGIGGFAMKRLFQAIGKKNPGHKIEKILHPSPASPAANRGWAEAVEIELREMGLWH